MMLETVAFKVSVAGRAKVLKERKKNVRTCCEAMLGSYTSTFEILGG